MDQGWHSVRAADPLTSAAVGTSIEERGTRNTELLVPPPSLPKFVSEVAAMDRELRKPDAKVGPPRVPLRNNPKVRSAFYQVIVLLLVLGCAYAFAVNASANLRAQGFASG